MKRIMFLLMTSFVIATGCATKPKEVEPSGFLRDYSGLRRTLSTTHAAWLYVNDKVDFRIYNKIMIERLVFFFREGDPSNKLDAAQKEQLENDYHAALVDALSDVYSIVTEPGPGVVLLRVAITDFSRTKVANKIITTMEAELLDSQTGERLSAAMDSQVSWRQAKHAFDRWAERLRRSLDLVTGRR